MIVINIVFMKNQNKLIVEYFTIISSIFFALFCWRFIEIPYKNVDIAGQYSDKSYNAINDTLKYLWFISFPTIIFIILKIKNSNNPIFFFYKNISEYSFKNKLNYNLIVCFFLLILFIIFQFLSISFEPFFLDIYHDGQKLSSAYKSFLDNSLILMKCKKLFCL